MFGSRGSSRRESLPPSAVSTSSTTLLGYASTRTIIPTLAQNGTLAKDASSKDTACTGQSYGLFVCTLSASDTQTLFYYAP